MRRIISIGSAVGVLVAVVGLLAIGPAGSSGDDIRYDREAGTIAQDLPDLSGEAHDEQALRAENDRAVACLEGQGMTAVASDLEFAGQEVRHVLRYDRSRSGLSADDALEVELRCTGRLAVLVTDFEPRRAS